MSQRFWRTIRVHLVASAGGVKRALFVVTLALLPLLILGLRGDDPRTAKYRPAAAELAPPIDLDIPPPLPLLVSVIVPPGLLPPVAAVAGQLVVVEATDEAGETIGLSTGVVIKKDRVLTVAHGVRIHGEDSAGLIIHCGGKSVVGWTVALDYIHDVAVIAADCGGRTLKIAKKRLNEGETAFAVGYSFARASVEVLGNMLVWKNPAAVRYAMRTTIDLGTAALDPSDNPDTIEPSILFELALLARRGAPWPVAFRGVVIPGNSGSPVCGPNGTIIGLAKAADTPKNRSFMVPADSLRFVLDAAGLR
jgi:S1-C subfamily serine protease